MDTTVLIGGGLSGLATARRLVRAGRGVVVLEARERVGGRILSPGGFDLGPAWIWPGQSRAAALLDELGLETFEQHRDGEQLFEDAQGQVLRGTGMASMRAVPTWMAGHAKTLAVYPRPFWRTAGLSGDAGSRRGPLAEIHDASPEDGAAGALFGFMGVPAAARGDAAALRAAVLAQLVRLFGPQAATPVRLAIADWAREPFTATPRDAGPPGPHLRYGLPSALAALWDGRLLFGSTEVAAESGGLVEGALEAAEAVLARL